VVSHPDLVAPVFFAPPKRAASTAFRIGLAVGLLALAGCNWFGEKKQPLPGERISVLSLDRQLEPDPEIAKLPITLPPPVVNPDWPQAGGYPNHAMQHLSLPDRVTEAWRASIGEGASRYTRVLSQPVVAKGRVYAMDGGVQVSALDAASGNRLWQVDLKPEDERGIEGVQIRALRGKQFVALLAADAGAWRLHHATGDF